MASNNAVHPSPTPKEEEEEVLDLSSEDEDAAKERQIEITPYEMQAPAVQVALPEANGDKGTTLPDVPLCWRSRTRDSEALKS